MSSNIFLVIQRMGSHVHQERDLRSRQGVVVLTTNVPAEHHRLVPYVHWQLLSLPCMRQRVCERYMTGHIAIFTGSMEA
ncbi:hypothetical protein CDL15_Pgr006808 [Punica granatum]|uniref:Uncharacterized protein n=1 Tax=Punica granatum TaxID=22663 RepID=A0A218X7K6_PUNGR|nr:hypothetical protein CDL15_Pgr006808 [Punica granatum]